MTRRPCWWSIQKKFFGKICIKIAFISQRREMLLFLTTNMAAVTSLANQQLDWVEYNSGSNRASNFKSAERVARGRFQITSTITPWIVWHEVQLPINRINNKMRECTIYVNFFFLLILKTSRIYFIQVVNSGETTIKRSQFSANDWRTCSETVWLQLSNYKKSKLDSCNWIPTWPHYCTIT